MVLERQGAALQSSGPRAYGPRRPTTSLHAPTPHASKVKTWVAAHAHEIELFYLPAYAPDHNPDEYLNNELKQKLRQQPQPATKNELIKNTRAVLRAIQRSPRRIQAYFRPPAVRYAA